MYQKKRQPAPRTENADGTTNALVEFRARPDAGSAEVLQTARELLVGFAIDESYEPVPMSGGSAIVRCRVRSQKDIDKLKALPGVLAVWTDAPIAPMTPS